MNIAFWLMPVVSFLIGAITFGAIICKVMKVDYRSVGSGNVGATNVGRAIEERYGKKVGKRFEAITMALDAVKILLCYFLAYYCFVVALHATDRTLPLQMGAFGVAGHCFSPFLKFKGGKGAASSLGLVLAYSPWLGVTTFVLWMGFRRLFNNTALASMSAVVCAVLTLTVKHFRVHPEPLMALWIYWGIGALVIVQHRKNIAELCAGKKTKIDPSRS